MEKTIMLKRISSFVLIGTLALSLGLSGLTPKAFAAAPARTVPGQYIVVFNDAVADADAATDDLVRAHGLGLLHKYGAALKGFAATIPAVQLATLKADPRVAFVSEDGIVEAVGTEPVISGDSVPTGVRRIEAGTTTTVHQASTVNVAVIDTGIDLSHPDLNAVNGKNCVRTRKTAIDDNGHGSHVAGTIAARNNGSGVEGVAPGTKLYAVKVLNARGSGTWSQVICGIDWVTANAATLNIKVASMSLGGTGSNDNNCGNTNNDALHKALCNSVAAGVTYVVAAGNETDSLDNHVPAAYPEALTVTAVSDSDGAPGGTGSAPTCRTGEQDDKYATFSNFATTTATLDHTIAAPGVCIYSTWKSGGYNTISGTSMATPHVSGVVALCIGNGGVAGPCNGLSPAQIIQKLRSDAQAHATASNGFMGDPLHPVTGKMFGYLVWAGGY
jgi:subtilisin family serine protease